MNTIEAYEKDILLQTKFLQKFKPQTTLSHTLQKNSIFCGSGDSLAAAMLAEAFSDFRVRAADPLDLLKNKSILKQKNLFVISISGNTISNIKASRLAKKSFAITSNPKSRLAKACNKSIILQAPNSDVFTAGSISFFEAAITCISLVSKFKKPSNVDAIFKKAYNDAKKAKFGKRLYILGNLHTYPVAMYGAAKFYELLGVDASYERIEQFSHMELFSCNKGDTVILFEEKTDHNAILARNLRKVGLNVIHPHLGNLNKIAQMIYYAFFSQLLPLFQVKKRKQKDCHFVISKKLRKVSDNMIY